MKMTSSILIVLDLFSLPDRNKPQMLKTRQNRRQIHRRLLHPNSHHLLCRTTLLRTKNPLIRMTGRQDPPRILRFGTSFVLLSKGKDQKVTPPIRTDTFFHLLGNIDSRCPTGCLQVHNDHFTFSQRGVDGLPHSIHWSASTPHPVTNPPTPSMLSPRDGLVHLLRVLRQTLCGLCVQR